MPLRIRCPHCSDIQLVPDEAAGWERPCLACGKTLTVPLPRRETASAPPATDVAMRCPRCKADVAPGTEICKRCCTVLATGKRLPLRKRLARMSLRARMLAFLSLVLVAVISVSGYEYYRNAKRAEARPASPTVIPAEVSYRDLVDALLAAREPAARGAAVDAMRAAGRAALVELSECLAADGGDATTSPESLVAAIGLLDTSPDAAWLPALTKVSTRRECADAAVLARAALGDATAAEAAQRVWLTRLRDQTFQQRAAKQCGDDSPARRELLRRREAALNTAALALQKLQSKDLTGMLGTLAEQYWESWRWLGQARGEAFADALFELSKPAPQAGDDFRERIRRARLAIEGASESADARSVAAFVLVLAHAAPQYQDARTRLLKRLASLLPDCEPVDQQRIAWTYFRLTGLPFGALRGEAHPDDADFASLEAAVRWSVSAGLTAGYDISRRRLSQRPPFELRVVPVHRQIEDELAAQIERGWSAIPGAIDRWQAAGLGVTERVRAWTDPGQRAPHPPALAAGLILLAEFPESRARDVLDLWRGATDQPAWMSTMARVTQAAIDARRGRSSFGWAAVLGPESVEEPADGPPLELWARLISAGGPPMVNYLRSARECRLSFDVREQLVERADELARRPR